MTTVGNATVYHGWTKDVLPTISADSFDSVVCDPPYGLSKEPDMVEVLTHWLAGDDYQRDGGGFMGKSWDSFVPGPATWREVYRVLKPGGYALVFAGSRTVDLMAVALRLAGFEIRDQIQWVYGSGFPKSLDISKAIDKAAGVEFAAVPASGVGFMNAEGAGGYNVTKNKLIRTGDSTDAARQWAGWGTALKPAHEPVIVARKPLGEKTVAANVLRWGTGGLNIDGCRVSYEHDAPNPATNPLYRRTNGYANGNAADAGSSSFSVKDGTGERNPNQLGRFPANLIHDGSDEVLACFPDAPGQQADVSHTAPSSKTSNVYGAMKREGEPSADSDNNGAVGFKMKPGARRLDAGSAARFFYCAKASRSDRGEYNNHPTVKPQSLMRYLCRLVTPPGGRVLDPFAGSGSTGVAAIAEGFLPTLIEQDADSHAVCLARCFEATY